MDDHDKSESTPAPRKKANEGAEIDTAAAALIGNEKYIEELGASQGSVAAQTGAFITKQLLNEQNDALDGDPLEHPGRRRNTTSDDSVSPEQSELEADEFSG